MAEPKRLKAGKAFERLVLSDFVNNSHDTQVENNRTIETSIGNGKYRKGRPDIMILDTGAVIAILEVKATNWNKIRPKNLKKNLWRHQNQLLRYVYRFVPETEGGVTLGLIHPKPQKNISTRNLVESYLDRYGGQRTGSMKSNHEKYQQQANKGIPDGPNYSLREYLDRRISALCLKLECNRASIYWMGRTDTRGSIIFSPGHFVG